MSNSLIINTKQYYVEATEKVAKQFESTLNPFALPAIKQVSINVGLGKYDNKAKEEIYNYILKLTGQKPKKVLSNKSISTFKLRKGDFVGLIATLRGKTAADFLLNLIFMSLPRTRDFKGVSAQKFDKNYSTYSIGIPSCSIFPVIDFGSSVDFGMQINIVFKTSSINNKFLLQELNFPFSK